jgi:transposase
MGSNTGCGTSPSLALQTQLGDLQQQYHQLQLQVDQLQGRVDQTSNTSNKPPSSDSPFKKPKRGGSSGKEGSSGKRGGRKGHPGSGPILLEPTEVQVVHPAACECGHSGLVTSVPYHTHQVIELPPIEMQITHFELHQGHCVGCGRLLKAEVASRINLAKRLSHRLWAALERFGWRTLGHAAFPHF